MSGLQMPKSNKIVLPDDIFDASYKLLKCQREMLRHMHDRGMSYKQLADYYTISKSAAYYICNPAAALKKVEKWKGVAHQYYEGDRKKRKIEINTRSRKKVKSIIEQFKKAS